MGTGIGRARCCVQRPPSGSVPHKRATGERFRSRRIGSRVLRTAYAVVQGGDGMSVHPWEVTRTFHASGERAVRSRKPVAGLLSALASSAWKTADMRAGEVARRRMG